MYGFSVGVEICVLGAGIVIPRLADGAGIDEDDSFFVAVVRILHGIEVFGQMRNVGVAAEHKVVSGIVSVLCDLLFHFTPIRIMETAVDEQEFFA